MKIRKLYKIARTVDGLLEKARYLVETLSFEINDQILADSLEDITDILEEIIKYIGEEVIPFLAVRLNSNEAYNL